MYLLLKHNNQFVSGKIAIFCFVFAAVGGGVAQIDFGEIDLHAQL